MIDNATTEALICTYASHTRHEYRITEPRFGIPEIFIASSVAFMYAEVEDKVKLKLTPDLWRVAILCLRLKDGSPHQRHTSVNFFALSFIGMLQNVFNLNHMVVVRRVEA